LKKCIPRKRSGRSTAVELRDRQRAGVGRKECLRPGPACPPQHVRLQRDFLRHRFDDERRLKTLGEIRRAHDALSILGTEFRVPVSTPRAVEARHDGVDRGDRGLGVPFDDVHRGLTRAREQHVRNPAAHRAPADDDALVCRHHALLMWGCVRTPR
jgi:hypothetical protein